MEISNKDTFIFLRVDPGEELVECLRTLSDELSLNSAAIISGVGMLNGACLGFFSASENKYHEKVFEGIYDLSSVQGSITRMNGKAVPHVHATFNNPEHITYSGHVIKVICHLTIELWLQKMDVLKLKRLTVPDRPSSRIVKVA